MDPVSGIVDLALSVGGYDEKAPRLKHFDNALHALRRWTASLTLGMSAAYTAETMNYICRSRDEHVTAQLQVMEMRRQLEQRLRGHR